MCLNVLLDSIGTLDFFGGLFKNGCEVVCADIKMIQQTNQTFCLLKAKRLQVELQIVLERTRKPFDVLN